MRQRWPLAAALGVSTVLALMLLAGHGPWSGPPVIRVIGSHGINLGDLAVVGLWMVGAACTYHVWRRE